MEEISTFLSFVSGAAAASVAFIAWIKLTKVNDQNETDILLSIDKRWGNHESIKARMVIHKLYRDINERYKNCIENLPKEEKDTFIQAQLGYEIAHLSKEITLTDDFIYLLNFLDFMESIAFLVKEDRVTPERLNALCGESLMFNYKIFKPYMDEKRDRHGDKSFYVNFDYLYKKLSKLDQIQKSKN
ncbi:MAG: hypothetical protein FJX71_06315 [Alphaproteobacteria bacterium]|nr:hypothetical protein [Alphaproteobacteria bacterium]